MLQQREFLSVVAKEDAPEDGLWTLPVAINSLLAQIEAVGGKPTVQRVAAGMQYVHPETGEVVTAPPGHSYYKISADRFPNLGELSEEKS